QGHRRGSSPAEERAPDASPVVEIHHDDGAVRSLLGRGATQAPGQHLRRHQRDTHDLSDDPGEPGFAQSLHCHRKTLRYGITQEARSVHAWATSPTRLIRARVRSTEGPSRGRDNCRPPDSEQLAPAYGVDGEGGAPEPGWVPGVVTVPEPTDPGGG